MAEFAKAVGGDKVEVSTIIPDRASIHDFEPKARDMAKISRLMFLYITGLERTMGGECNKSFVKRQFDCC